MLQVEYDLVPRPPRQPNKDKLKIETQFSEATGQCRHIFTDMKIVENYFPALKPSVCAEMLEELQRMSAGLRSSLI